MYCRHLLLSTMLPSATQRLLGMVTSSAVTSRLLYTTTVSVHASSGQRQININISKPHLPLKQFPTGLLPFSTSLSAGINVQSPCCKFNCQEQGSLHNHHLLCINPKNGANISHVASGVNFHHWTKRSGSNENTAGCHPLLRTPSLFRTRRAFSISPKAILEASPPSFQPYLRLIRFDKPIGTMLLLWPCTWSIALAASPGQLPDLWMLTLFSAGAFFMRGAGCIINDMWDKDFDKKVERTRQRPLASGELTHFQALVFLASQLSISLGILLQLNTYSILLGASSMILVVLYPLAKRYTYWPQIMLGFTFNYGALLGWSAVQGSCDLGICLPLYASGIMWTLMYDTIYAHQDKYDDMLIGVKSTALKLGDQTKPWLAGFSTLMISSLTTAGYMADQTWPYYAGVSFVAAHLAHQLYTVDLNNADDCASKFRAHSRLGFVLFLAIVVSTLMRKEKKDGATVSDSKEGSVSDNEETKL